MHELRVRRRIEFADTDMGGIVHFARFYVFMEGAEHEFLRRLGASPGAFRDAEGPIAWPRVAASCEFLAPARFGDELEIHVRVLRKGTKSLTYAFDIRREDTAIARGKVTAVYCRVSESGGLQAVPIPADIAEQIEEA
ncbi:MAG TPA: thioesterase family protein [Thermoanaerobaculia bacterium]|nr:thioesterase family protein [Thermoanaerobaculia bacterium]